MSVRVNLLPEEVRQRGQADRARILAGVLGLVLVLVLAGLSFMQRQQIDDAEQRLADVEAQNQELQADIAALQPFADLEARAQDSIELVSLALGGEHSLATVLQDLSAVVPPNAQFDTINISLLDEAASPAAGGNRLVFGRVTASGKVLEGIAPGVERLIIDLDRVAAFDNAYVTTSSINEDGIAAFSLEVELGPEVLSGRYAIVEDAGGTP